MVEDREAQLYRDVADLREQVPKLQEMVNELAIKNEQLEASGFQSQILSLNKKINKLNSRLVDSEKIIADFFITDNKVLLLDAIDAFPAKNEKENKAKQEAREWVIEQCAIALKGVYNSKNPLDIAVELWHYFEEEADKRSSPSAGEIWETLIKFLQTH
jgi:hypothetical protein